MIADSANYLQEKNFEQLTKLLLFKRTSNLDLKIQKGMQTLLWKRNNTKCFQFHIGGIAGKGAKPNKPDVIA